MELEWLQMNGIQPFSDGQDGPLYILRRHGL